MPIPKLEDPKNLRIGTTQDGSAGEPAKKLVTVVKPYKKDMPDILDRLVELASAQKEKS